MVGSAILVLGVVALFAGLFTHLASTILVVGLWALLVFFDVGALRGSISDLGATGIAVSKNVAQAQHLKLGDAVPALFKDTGLRKRLPQPGVSSRSVFEMKSVGIGRCRGRLRN